MKVLYVVNSLYSKGNGLCNAVRRNMKELEKRGIEIRVLSGMNHNGDEQPDYILPDYKIPIFHGIVRKQGYQFAKADKKVIIEAIKWADVIHLEEPFAIQVKTAKLAKNIMYLVLLHIIYILKIYSHQ